MPRTRAHCHRCGHASARGRKLEEYACYILYSIHSAIYNTGQEDSTSAKRTRGVQAAVILREYEQATSTVFAGLTSKEIYIIANFQASNGFHQSRP